MKPALRRLDWMLAAIQSLLLLLLLGAWNGTGAPRAHLVLLAGSLLLLVLCRSMRPRSGAGRAFCEWGFLYPFIAASYLATGLLIPFYRPVGDTHDEVLASLDGRLFGMTPSGWDAWTAHPVVVELCFLGYASYFLFGLLLMSSLQGRFGCGSRVFRSALSASVLAFYISYLGYWLFPAQGPRHLWGGSWGPLEGLLLAGPALEWLGRTLPGFRDAFPSEHVMFSVVAGYYWFRYAPRVFRVMAPLLVLSAAATLVLRYHWVVDVAAGLLLAPGVIALAERGGEWIAGTTMKTMRNEE